MYNRYIPNGTAYTRITEPDPPPSAPPRRKEGKAEEKETPGNGLLSSLLKSLKLEELDSGDVLLLLILLLLFLDGEDNMELLIALGLILILGLGRD